jgi:hypothetical protein
MCIGLQRGLADYPNRAAVCESAALEVASMQEQARRRAALIRSELGTLAFVFSAVPAPMRFLVDVLEFLLRSFFEFVLENLLASTGRVLIRMVRPRAWPSQGACLLVGLIFWGLVAALAWQGWLHWMG